MKVIPGTDSDPREVNITHWNVTNMTSTMMTLYVQFKSQILVSRNDMKDWLQIEFRIPQYFVDVDLGKSIGAKYSVIKR